jgi:hypothetical protein
MIFSYFVFVPTQANRSSNDFLENWDEAYSALAEDCLDFKKSVSYSSSLDLRSISYDTLVEKIAQKDRFKAGCLYYISWQTENKGGSYYTTFYFKYYINSSQHDKVIDMAKDFADEMRGFTDYEKIKTVHDYLIENSNYNIGSDGPYRTLYKGQSNCNGYALSFLAIMRECNIDCTYETGDNHAWNAVKLDGEWYNIDVTWDDSGVWDKEGGTRYDYFLKSDADFNGHHHGCATAKTSYNADLSVDKNIKNFATAYKIRNAILISILVIFVISGYTLFKKFKKKHKLTPMSSSNKYDNYYTNTQNTSQYINDDDITCGR